MDNKELLHNVQDAGFAVVEANLYLDAYPECEQALEYYNQKVNEYENTVKEYEEHCGPLTAKANKGGKWHWIYTPWPWEMGVN